jgi:steroid delta-isomerase-like uncharacterized protein
MRSEGAKDFTATVATFSRPRYEVVATGEEHDGARAVSDFLAESGRAFPDFRFENTTLHHADDAVVVEVDFVGTHLGAWRGLPATGRAVRYRMCNVFVFEEDRLVCERLHFDLLTILRQIGIARDPTSLAGRVATFANHPITVGRALLRGLIGGVTTLLLVGAVAGCGSAPAPAPSAAAPSKPADPAAACLALAEAKRPPAPNAPQRIGARHVLVKYTGAKRADPSITRTREQACLRALEARDKLRAGAEFADIVKEYSDEAGAATRGGAVGTIERPDVAPPFADAAFELEINQLSDVVETDFGFHVIFRTE